MNDHLIESALAESVKEVLEKMFFMDLPDAPAGEAPAVGLAAELLFEGDPPGSFRLLLDRTAASSAATDFLGEAPADDEQMNEVVCELANMICGSVLSRIESSATFRLTKPAIVSSEELEPVAPAAGFQAAVGGGFLRVEIRMERTLCTGINEHAS